MSPLLNKEPKKTWCHEHEVWECWWIEGIGQEVGAVWPLVSCHEPVISEQEPWCKEHKP